MTLTNLLGHYAESVGEGAGDLHPQHRAAGAHPHEHTLAARGRQMQRNLLWVSLTVATANGLATGIADPCFAEDDNKRGAHRPCQYLRFASQTPPE